MTALKTLLLAALVLWSGGLVPGAEDDADRVELFKDDFSRFAPGLLSAPLGQLNGAIQEYHYIEHRGVATRITTIRTIVRCPIKLRGS
jgi:hypothetical protein